MKRIAEWRAKIWGDVGGSSHESSFPSFAPAVFRATPNKAEYAHERDLVGRAATNGLGTITNLVKMAAFSKFRIAAVDGKKVASNLKR